MVLRQLEVLTVGVLSCWAVVALVAYVAYVAYESYLPNGLAATPLQHHCNTTATLLP